MTIFLIAICMYLTACVSVRFVAEIAHYKGNFESIANLFLSGLEIVALAYLFTLL